MSRVSLAYTGIVAETYDLLVTNDAIGDAEYFRAVIRDRGEPALEIGCGTGRLLLDYVADGLDVEGVDPSPDMLRICRRKMEQRGLTVTVHMQAMQSLDLARRFQTLFVPAGSFMLLTDRGDAEHALARFYAHLGPRGTGSHPARAAARPRSPGRFKPRGRVDTSARGLTPRGRRRHRVLGTCARRPGRADALVGHSLRDHTRRPDYSAPRGNPDDSLVHATGILRTARACRVHPDRRAARVHVAACRATRRGIRLRRPAEQALAARIRGM